MQKQAFNLFDEMVIGASKDESVTILWPLSIGVKMLLYNKLKLASENGGQ